MAEEKKRSRTGLSKTDMDTVVSYLTEWEIDQATTDKALDIMNRRAVIEDIVVLINRLGKRQEATNHSLMKRIWIYEEIIKENLQVSEEQMHQRFEDLDKQYDKLMEENIQKALDGQEKKH